MSYGILAVVLAILFSVVARDVWGWLPIIGRCLIKAATVALGSEQREERRGALGEQFEQQFDERRLSGVAWILIMAPGLLLRGVSGRALQLTKRISAVHRLRTAERVVNRIGSELALEARRFGAGPILQTETRDGGRRVLRFENRLRTEDKAVGSGSRGSHLHRLVDALPDGRLEFRGISVDDGGCPVFVVAISFDPAVDPPSRLASPPLHRDWPTFAQAHG